MESRDSMVADIHAILLRAGFVCSDPRVLAHAGFDLVAKKGGLILVVKVSLNANYIGESSVRSMLALATSVDGAPILISRKAGREPLEDGVMYSRSNIPLITPRTFTDLVTEGIPPLVYAASGGFYVRVDSDIISKARQGGLSLGDLAEMAGVSRRAIRMYEEGMSAKLEIALKLEEGLGTELILPVDPIVTDLEYTDESEEETVGLTGKIFLRLHSIGYSVRPTSGCPFDAVTKDRSIVLFTGVDRKRPGLDRKAKAISNLSRILEKHSVMFIDGRGDVLNIEGTPVIGSRELGSIRSKKHVIELIEERS